MEKDILNIKNSECIEYVICTYLMRKRILKAYIHTPNENLMDRLSEYMYLCKIPHGYVTDSFPKEQGYILCCSNNIFGEELIPHVFIRAESDKSNLDGENVFQLIINDDLAIFERNEKIDLDAVPLHLQNSQIRKMFLYAFEIAEQEIDIISPWMNAGVIDNDFLKRMDRAFARGVKIKILYGLKPSSNEYNLSRSRRSDEMAELLRNTFADKGDLLSIKRDNIHYKLVLCDEKYKLEGGYNYLSFVGNYNDSDTRREGSPFGRNVEEMRLLRKQYFGE